MAAMISDDRLRNILLKNIERGTYEELVTLLNPRFGILPVSCVAQDILADVESESASNSSHEKLQARIFDILKSILDFRKTWAGVDFQQASTENVPASFTGFVLERNVRNMFVRPISPHRAGEKHEIQESRIQKSQILLEQHQQKITELKKELKDMNKAYAIVIEENDALVDEVDTANTKIRGLARNNDRKRKRMEEQQQVHETTIAMLQVRWLCEYHFCSSRN